MERTTGIDVSRDIMGINFIGPEELNRLHLRIGILGLNQIDKPILPVPFSEDQLRQVKEDYLLILGMPFFKDRSPLTLLKMKDHFGSDPVVSEPCFYNQDWYLNEEFANSSKMDFKWYLLRKEVICSTRGKGVEMQNVVEKQCMPSALVCAYAFFSFYCHSGQYLWENDFVWCSDTDVNGDRIYVARYFDPKKISKNGFSIHRHLRIQQNYGCIDII